MARIVLISPYLKGGQNAAKLMHRTRYVATHPGVELPADICKGDIIAVCTTGAYNYSMASNYNRLPRPPIVMLAKDRSYEAVRRETLEDLVALDL